MTAEFDDYAGDYAQALSRGLSASGENQSFFAAGRVRWLARRLRELAPAARLDSILDYGAGCGSTTPLLLELAADANLLGVDISARSLDVARRDFGGERARFALVNEHTPNAEFSLAYCNGIFHHIPPADRLAAARYIYDSLRPGGFFAFWENNPWNPGTRWVMSRIPFDRDAVPLSMLESRKLLGAAGFSIVRTDFLFIFPRFLRALRAVEPGLSALPLGGQYQVLCQKPATSV